MKCESCGRKVEHLIKIKGQNFCIEWAVEAQKNIDPESVNFGAYV